MLKDQGLSQHTILYCTSSWHYMVIRLVHTKFIPLYVKMQMAA